MLSILIPSYNYVCTELVRALVRQGEALAAETGTAFAYEIIVGDDGSTDTAALQANRAIDALPHCRFWEAGRNLGRAALRNRLADMAAGPYLIYIDCDARVEHDDFLRRYWLAARKARVVVGGVRNVSTLPSPTVSLRFRYEARADRRRSAACRQRTPYQNFSTFNFLIERELMREVRFNEQCRHYGYEDAYLGMELEQRHVPVMHIDNALVHLGLDTNDVFLHKTETALRTLHSLDETIRRHAAVSRLARRLERYHLMPAVRLGHRLLGPWVRRQLLSPRPSLLLFSAYKLGFYGSLPHKGGPEPRG